MSSMSIQRMLSSSLQGSLFVLCGTQVQKVRMSLKCTMIGKSLRSHFRQRSKRGTQAHDSGPPNSYSMQNNMQTQRKPSGNVTLKWLALRLQTCKQPRESRIVLLCTKMTQRWNRAGVDNTQPNNCVFILAGIKNLPTFTVSESSTPYHLFLRATRT